MNADAVQPQGNSLAVARSDRLIADHLDHPRPRRRRVPDHAALDPARRQVAVVLVEPVGESLAGRGQAERLAGVLHLGAGERDIDQIRIHHLERAAYGVGDLAVLGGHVVERAVGLDVRHPHAGIGGERLQRADLVGDRVLQLVRLHVDAPAPETPEIVEAGMSADADPFLLRPHHYAAHDDGVAGVEAARHARRADDLENGVVVADVVSAEALAHVGVEIDLADHGAPSPSTIPTETAGLR